jgi:hypothetical protein
MVQIQSGARCCFQLPKKVLANGDFVPLAGDEGSDLL